MTTPTRESATIYQFPARGRFAATTETRSTLPRAIKAVVTGAWYHDEAIRMEDTYRAS